MNGSGSAGGAESAPLAGVLIAAALSGAAVMSIELSAVRTVAPWFGSSLAVWTNVLGVVLAALTVGYLFGARAAKGPRPVRRLSVVLGLGALASLATPYLATPVCNTFLPQEVALGDASRLIAVGSLAAAACLFLPSATILGAVGPLAVEAVQRRRGGHAGTAGGVVLAVSTLGSLVGTFATSHALLPGLGVERTFQFVAVALGVAATLLAFWSRGGAVRAGAAVVLVVSVAGPSLGDGAAVHERPGRQLLARADSPYQQVRVVELDADGSRRLEVNERTDSFQSVWFPEPGLLPDGYYYNDFLLPVWWEWIDAGGVPTSWRVGILGLGGGTAWRVLEGAGPEGTELSGIGVELDPEVVRLAREHLDLPGDGAPLQVLAGSDARVALRSVGDPLDQVVLDTYANQVEIPPHLATSEFLSEVRECLRDGGWLTMNVGAFGLDDPLLGAIATTTAEAFGGSVLALRVPRSRNVTLVARRGSAPPAPRAEPLLGGVPGIDALLRSRTWPGTHRWFEPTPVAALTDDRAPTDILQQESLQLAERSSLPTAEEGRRLLAAMPESVDLGATDLERARQASRILESAGDLAGTYGISAAGLEAEPDDLELRLRASSCALALGRAGVGIEHLRALEESLSEVGDMPVDTRDWWDSRVLELRQWSSDSTAQSAARQASLARSKATVGGAAVLVLLAIGVGLWRVASIDSV